MILELWFISFFTIGWWIADLIFEFKNNFMKRKQPDTSRIANSLFTEELRQEDFKKIIKALASLGEGNYEAISIRGNFKDRNSVSRRLKEMEGLNPKYPIKYLMKTGRKSMTTSGRPANNYTLCIKGDIVEKKPEPKFVTLKEVVKEYKKHEKQQSLF